MHVEAGKLSRSDLLSVQRVTSFKQKSSPEQQRWENIPVGSLSVRDSAILVLMKSQRLMGTVVNIINGLCAIPPLLALTASFFDVFG
jgi:hypothetical protein